MAEYVDIDPLDAENDDIVDAVFVADESKDKDATIDAEWKDVSGE